MPVRSNDHPDAVCDECGKPAIHFWHDLQEIAPAKGADGRFHPQFKRVGPEHKSCDKHFVNAKTGYLDGSVNDEREWPKERIVG